MDDNLNEFAHFIYRSRKGQGLGLVSKVKAGLEFYCPEYYDKLKRTDLSLQGWRKMAVHEPHQVCPEAIAFLIAKKLIALGEANAGVGILLLFDTYIRAFELKALKVSDVMILPEDGSERPHHAVIHLDKGKRDSHQTIMVRPLFLARLLKKWKERRRIVAGNDAKLLGMGSQKFRDLIHRATSELGLAELKVTPHTLRYGGATSDKLYTRLSDEEIQRRGRWKETKTFRHYVQVAGLLKQEELVPPEVKERAEAIRANPFRHFQV